MCSEIEIGALYISAQVFVTDNCVYGTRVCGGLDLGVGTKVSGILLGMIQLGAQISFQFLKELSLRSCWSSRIFSVI